MINQHSTSPRTLWYFFILSAILLLAYTWYDYRQEYSAELQRLDKLLLSFANTTHSLLAIEYHTTPLKENTVDGETEYYWGQKLTEISVSADLKYIYTMLLDGDTIRFLNSSFTPEEISGASEWQPVYWSTYDEADPRIYDAFSSEEPIYLNHNDRWGSFRSVFIRVIGAEEQSIVIGVDTDIDSLFRIRRNALKRSFVSLAILLIIIGLWWRANQKHQQQIIKTNSRINNALAGSKLALWEWDLPTDEFYISPIFYQLYGYSDGEFPARLNEILSLIHEDDRKLFETKFKEAIHSTSFNKHRQDYEFRFKRKNGSFSWTRSQSENIEWTKIGRPLKRSGIVESIDTIKNYQKQLLDNQKEALEREQFLSSLLENMPDYVSLKNPDGVYLNCNNAMERLFGVPRSQIIGKTDFDFVPFHIAEIFKNNDNKAVNSNELVRVEEWITIEDSPRLLETIKVGLRDADGDYAGVVSIGRDVTEKHNLLVTQKRISKDLEIAKEHEVTANRSKTMFLANMSHEIRTPLNAILGYSQLLQQEKALPALVSERLTYIHDAGLRLLNLINDILDVSKIEAGKSRLSLKPFELNEVLNNNIGLMEERSAQKGIKLLVNIELPNTYVIETDPQKLNQIITNLLSNAIKFTTKGSVILHCSLSKQDILISIKDTGVGIKTDEQKNLFKPFSQGDSGANSGEGTGLGLVLCKRLSQLMGGDVTLESKYGEGTTVILALPRAKLESNAVPNNNNGSSTPGTLKEQLSLSALVIDDDMHSEQVMGALLKQMGFKVHSLSHATEWRSTLQEHDFDVIFTDIRMPELQGDQLLKLIKNDVDFKEIPVVAVTASSLDHERSHYISIGFDDFISKPVAISELNHCVERIFPDALRHAQGQINKALKIESIEHFSEHDIALFQAIQQGCAEGNASSVKNSLDQLSHNAKQTNLYKTLITTIRDYDFVSAEAFLKSLT